MQELHGFGIFEVNSYRMRSLLFIGFILFFGSSYTQTTGIMTDTRDGKVYKTVVIGSQTWMAENLNVSTFRNGDPIPEARTNEEWEKAGKEGKPAWCYYDNDPKNGSKYGKLYNWYAVNDPRGLAPKGWYIPSHDEWTTLENYLGDHAGKKMKSTIGWDNWEEDLDCSNCKVASYEYKKICSVCKGTGKNGKKTRSGNGTNSSGFSVLPGGSREIWGPFNAIGYNGYWWSSTSYNYHALARNLHSTHSNVDFDPINRSYGLSIRCIKD